MELMKTSCKRQGNRYTIGLFWKKVKALLPNNYPLAKKRLFSLEKNLPKDKAKAKMYDETMMEYERNGWVRLLSEQEVQADVKPVYHLPLHEFYRHEKKSTPLTIVFDPACQFQGVSLTSFFHEGPYPIGNLFGALLRFREEPVASVGDIWKMLLHISAYQRKTSTFVYSFGEIWIKQGSPPPDAFQRVTFRAKPSPDSWQALLC